MRLVKPARLLRFAAVGAINTIVGISAVVIAARLFGLSAYIANAIGFSAGIVAGYLLNRIWTFASTESAARTGPRYVFAFVASYAVNLGILTILLRESGVSPILAQAAALTGYSLVFYFLCRTIVFPASR